MMLLDAEVRWQGVWRSCMMAVTTLTVCLTATGGEVVQSLLLAVPLMAALAISGYIGGLLAICGSLGGVSIIYSVLALAVPRVAISPGVTFFATSIGAFGLAVIWQYSIAGSDHGSKLKVSPPAYVPLLIALLSSWFISRWTTFSELEFFNSLAGSEDNAAWITAAASFVSGEVGVDSLLGSTNSPVTSTLLGFVSDIYSMTQSDVPEHLLALRALRCAYALVIILTAIAAGAWVSVVAGRTGASRSWGSVASLTVAIAVLGSSAFLLVGLGFFSLINALMFALVAVIGFEVAFSDYMFRNQVETVLILVLCGFGGSWTGVTPLAGVLILVVISSPGIGKRWRESTCLWRTQKLVIGTLGIVFPLLTWKSFIAIQNGQIASQALNLTRHTGTVPVVETSWIPSILLVVIALVNGAGEWRRRSIQLLLVLYVTAVWMLSLWQSAEPRYAAQKALVVLSLLAMVGLGVVLIERVPRMGIPALLAGLALVLLWSSLVHESHNGLRGLGRNDSTTTVQSEILETFKDHPGAKVVCLHQDPDLRIAAYLCSRWAMSFSPGPSPELRTWTRALLNSDISPNGIEISRDDHVGSLVLRGLRERPTSSTLFVIILGGNPAQGVDKNLGPDFWWVSELDWGKIEPVFH